jgi:hypothetical protein
MHSLKLVKLVLPVITGLQKFVDRSSKALEVLRANSTTTDHTITAVS